MPNNKVCNLVSLVRAIAQTFSLVAASNANVIKTLSVRSNLLIIQNLDAVAKLETLFSILKAATIAAMLALFYIILQLS
jgi:hypothetical protein